MNWLKNDGKIVLSGLVMMIVMGSVYSFSVFRTPIEEVYNIPHSSSGYPYMISLFFYSISMGIAGRLLQKFKNFHVMLIGVVLIGLGWFVSYLSNTLFVLTIGYGVLVGTGIGFIYGIPLVVITNRYPRHKGLYYGIVLSGFGVSPLFSAPLFRHFIHEFGVNQVFLYTSIFAFVTLLLLSFLYVDTDEEEITKTVTSAIKDKRFYLVYMLFFIATLIGLSVIGFTATYANDIMGYSTHISALLVSLFAVFNGLGRVVVGYLVDRFDYKLIIKGSFVLFVLVSLMLLLFSEVQFVYLLSFGMFWFQLGGWLAIAPYVTSNLFGKESYSLNYGMMFSAYGLSALFGVYISSVLHSYDVVFFVFLIISFVGLLIIELFGRILDNDSV